jgi:exosortase
MKNMKTLAIQHTQSTENVKIIHRFKLLNCLVFLLFLLVYAPTLGWLWQRWMMGVWYNAHGVLIPFVSAYLIWNKLRLIDSDATESGHTIGFWFLIPALMLHIIDNRLYSQLLSALSIVPALIGLAFLYMGKERTVSIWFPLVLLLFMVPVPLAAVHPVILKLRLLSAMGATEIIRVLGIPIIRTGTSIEFTNATLNVADPCSGFATLSATLAFAAITLYLWPIRGPKAFLYIICAFPIALLANVFRTAALALLVLNFGREILGSFLHPLSGYITYVIAIGLQVVILVAFRKMEHIRRCQNEMPP